MLVRRQSSSRLFEFSHTTIIRTTELWIVKFPVRISHERLFWVSIIIYVALLAPSSLYWTLAWLLSSTSHFLYLQDLLARIHGDRYMGVSHSAVADVKPKKIQQWRARASLF